MEKTKRLIGIIAGLIIIISILFIANHSNMQNTQDGKCTQQESACCTPHAGCMSVQIDCTKGYTPVCTGCDSNCKPVCDCVEKTGEPVVGGDKDEHGCIGSAGYSWCESKQKCLRTWEEPCSDNGSTDLANPASVYCEQQGGTLEIVDTSSGQIGMCHIDGKICEEWDYFRTNRTHCKTLNSNQSINSFEDCVAAGNPIMESYPRQCRTEDGRLFVEDLGNEGEFCNTDEDCILSAEYAIISRCPYTAMCINNTCTPVCPWDQQTACTEEQRNTTCTKDYRPVCGWFNQSIQCFAYPCANTYSNPCQACAEPMVAYYTEGQCPTKVSSSAKEAQFLQ